MWLCLLWSHRPPLPLIPNCRRATLHDQGSCLNLQRPAGLPPDKGRQSSRVPHNCDWNLLASRVGVPQLSDINGAQVSLTCVYWLTVGPLRNSQTRLIPSFAVALLPAWKMPPALDIDVLFFSRFKHTELGLDLLLIKPGDRPQAPEKQPPFMQLQPFSLFTTGSFCISKSNFNCSVGRSTGGSVRHLQ